MKLTIAIPTIGRPELADLLASIPPHPDVEVIVSDNSGAAEGICSIFPHVRYEARRYDIGRDANVLRCSTLGTGEFVWVIGDDDRLLPGALRVVLDALWWGTDPTGPPVDRLVLLTPETVDRIPEFDDRVYPTRHLIDHLVAAGDPSLLIAATLCSANVFRRFVLNPRVGLEKFDTYYGYAHSAVGAMTTRILRVPTFLVGTDYQESISAPGEIWQGYLDALCDAAAAPRIAVGTAMGWNYPWAAARAAKMTA